MTPELIALQAIAGRVIVPTIQTYIDDLLSPREEVTVNGACDSALIKRSIVDRLIAHPQFHKYGFIQGLGTKDNRETYNRMGERVYVLWRLKEWNALAVNKHLKLKRWDLEHTKRKREEERYEKAINTYIEIYFDPKRTGKRVDRSRVAMQILLWLEEYSDNIDYQKKLERLGYFVDRETALREVEAMENELQDYIAQQREKADKKEKE